MGNPNVARRHPDYPITINGTFAKRVQSLDLSKNTPTQVVDEMGNFAHAGMEQDTPTYAGTITWFPINAEMENFFCSTSGSTVTLNMFTSNNGATIRTPKLTYGGARIVGIEYAVQSQQEWRGTARIKGTTWTEETNSIVATEPTGVGSYRAKNVRVAVGGTRAVRCAGVTVRADLPSQDLYELDNADPVGTNYDSPTVSCDVDFYESDLIAGNTEPTLESPANIVITTGTTAHILTLVSMVGGTKSVRGTVRGWGTRRYSYQGKGDATTGGMTIAGA